MDKTFRHNPNLHKRRSVRLKEYDYAQEGLYFITICCYEKTCLFGKVENAEMILNDYGKIAHENWLRTAELRPEISLDVFIIMPNHMHAIINIEARRGVSHTPAIEQESQNVEKPAELNATDNSAIVSHTPAIERESLNVENSAEHNSSLNNIIHNHLANSAGVCDTPLRSPSGTVGAVIRGYKGSVSRQLKLAGFKGQVWQRNYYEHIIRTPKAYDEISDYIVNNPARWKNDRFYI